MKKYLKLTLKIALSTLLIGFVFSQIDTKQFQATLLKADFFWLVAAFIAFNLSKIVSSIRLNCYFKDLGIHLKEIANLKLYYLGMFYNLFLPGGIGGDGYKVYLLHKHYHTKIKHLISATLLDRISGVVALGFLAALLFLWSAFSAISATLNTLAIFFAIAILPLYLVSHRKFFSTFNASLRRTTLLALVVQLLQLLSALSIVYAMGATQTIEYLTIFLISSVVAVLPLTIGGVGAREFTFLYAFGLISLDPHSGVVFSILFFMITALSSLIGVLFMHKPILQSP
ncbi:MAG: flippase-like domain-containing protein [Campylobacterales bacterium]|nr:flippase-like domain-containing protein [Campylobacterales bacterium]